MPGVGRLSVTAAPGLRGSSVLQDLLTDSSYDSGEMLDQTDQQQAQPTAPATTQWFGADPLWFKRAVFYEIHLRGFADGNNDGSGDFLGLTEKLDYLQWLGVDCIWLLPMYPSPLRDGGYDIADFYSIHPDYGTRRGLPRPSSTRRTSAASA